MNPRIVRTAGGDGAPMPAAAQKVDPSEKVKVRRFGKA